MHRKQELFWRFLVSLSLLLAVTTNAAVVKAPSVNVGEPAGVVALKAEVHKTATTVTGGVGGETRSDKASMISSWPSKSARSSTIVAPVINHGTFAGAPYAKVDAASVSAFKGEASSIAAGGYSSDFDFKLMESCLISFDNHSSYVTDRGGCIYIVTAITGLQAGDIVEVDNNYYYDDGTGYYSYWDQPSYWVLISPYTHNSATTINNWLIYFESDGVGGYTMVIGSGEYNLALNNDDLTTTIGDRYQLTRSVRVLQGASLVSPLVSGRGYTYSSTGVTGGTEIDNDNLNAIDLTLVGSDPVWVNSSWSGSDNGDAVSGHVYGQDAFDNIGQGSSAVLPLGTVNVEAGTYVENLTIEQSMHLNGAGASLVTVYPSFSGANPGGGGSLPPGSSVLVLVQADNVEISGMTFDGDNPSLTSGIVVGGADLDARNGVMTNHPVGVYDNLHVHDCSVLNIYLRGLYASSGGTFDFHDNVVDNVNGEYASIGIFNFGGAGVIADNIVSNCNDAISANWSKGCQFVNNTITNCGSGVHTDNAGGNGGVADLIANNEITGGVTYSYGIFTFVPYTVPVVQNNTITNVDVGMTAAGSYTTATPQFLNNTVDGTGRVNSTGIYVTTSTWGYTSGNVSVLMQNNSVTNCADGMYLESEAGFANSLTFFGNELHSHANSFVFAATGTMGAGTFNLNLSGNWWGSTTPPAISSMIFAVADYTPWLGGGTPTDPGFIGDFSQLWVDDDSPQTGAVNRVQEAVNLVSGSTIYLMPGTFVGQVVASGFADLDIIGSGVGTTVLQAPAVAMTHFYLTSANNYAILSVENSADVDVSNLTIDGSGEGNLQYRFVGAGYFESGGSLTDVSILDVRNNPLDGGQHGVSVYAYAIGGTPRTLDLLRVATSGFQKTAMVFAGANLTANLDDCDILGPGPLGLGLPAQNGIQFSSSANGSINACTISDISYTQPAWAACGLLLFGPATIQATNNIINDVGVGAYFIDAGGSFVGNTYSASATGTGIANYFGVFFANDNVSKSNAPKVQPYDESDKGFSQTNESLGPLAPTIPVNGNTVSGDLGTGSCGIGASTGGVGNLVINMSGNRVTGFDYAISMGAGAGTSLTSSLTNSDVLFNNIGFENYGGVTDVTLNAFSNTTNATDDTPGNFYDMNCWHDWSGVGPYAIGGGGGNADANPRTDCGLDMSPNTIVYNCSGNFAFKVDVGSAVTALDAANIWIEYPAELSVASVTALDANYFMAYTQTTDILNTRDTLKVNLGVLTGVVDGPDSLFRVAMNGSASCLSGDIVMIYRDLRDSTNSQIIVPLASAIDFQSNCADPVIVVNSPVSGGFYNTNPVLSLTATDDCDLNNVYYQIDGCTPSGWQLIAGPLSGTVYNNAAWSMTPAEFAALSEAAHCIRFRVTDDFGRENANQCSYAWCFTKDITAPLPPTLMSAQPGHNKVNLGWVNSTSPDVVGVQIQRVPWTNYPEYGSSPALTPAPAYPANYTTGTTVHTAVASPGLPAVHIDVSGLSNATRDIYYYGAFAYDAAGNYSAAAVSAQARSTSYWLGDIAVAFDGNVYFADLVSFSSTYGLNQGQPGFNNHADFGPTHNFSPKGIPLPDNKVEFEDLAIFAINFNNVALMAPKNVPILTGDTQERFAGLRIVDHRTADGYYVDIYLDNPNRDAKSLIGEIAYNSTQMTLVSVLPSDAVSGASAPVFFKPIFGEDHVSISLAALGQGTTFVGSGLIASAKFELRSTSAAKPKLTRVEIRDNENQSLIQDEAFETQPETISTVETLGEFSILQNSPNPFNPETRIAYALPKSTQVSIRIYNVMGQLVKSLADGYQQAGTHEVVWNGTNDSGTKVASGIYFYRFETPEFQKTVKMTMLK